MNFSKHLNNVLYNNSNFKPKDKRKENTQWNEKFTEPFKFSFELIINPLLFKN